MPRVLGIDPGTVTVDVCGLEDGRVCLDLTLPTAEALARPSVLLDLLAKAGPFDLIVGPSGYGLPLVRARDLTDADLRLAVLAPPGTTGGIGGLGALMRALRDMSAPVVFTPGVVHLASVPRHRKINRVDMGTADKVCATVLAIHEQATRHRCRCEDVSLILLELGGAFTAAVAVEEGRIVDGVGGTSGPIGLRAAGALDGEVAALAGMIGKGRLFTGGAVAVAGSPEATPVDLTHPRTEGERLAWAALIEGAVKTVAALRVSVRGAREVALSGRLAANAMVRNALTERLAQLFPGTNVRPVAGFAAASHAAQGAALLADGLLGGRAASLVERLDLGSSSGTVLDHLYVVSPAEARARLGLG